VNGPSGESSGQQPNSDRPLQPDPCYLFTVVRADWAHRN
jgi:hypothetical protein